MDNNMTICSECGQEVNKGEVCIIDDKPLCLACMYGDVKPFEIFPIGKVTTDLQPHEVDGFAAGSKSAFLPLGPRTGCPRSLFQT